MLLLNPSLQVIRHAEILKCLLLEIQFSVYLQQQNHFKEVSTKYQDTSGNVTAHVQAWERGAHRRHHFYFQVSPITPPMGIISSLMGVLTFSFHKFKNYFQISLPQVQKSDELGEVQEGFFHNDVQKLTSIVTIISGQSFKVIGSGNKTTKTKAEKMSSVNLKQGLTQWKLSDWLSNCTSWGFVCCPLNSWFL